MIFQEYQTMAQLLSAAFGDEKNAKQKVIESADDLAALFKTKVVQAP